MESKFKMRPLLLRDVFAMSKIIKKMDLNLDVPDDITQVQFGVLFAQKIIENIHLAEEEISEFLAKLLGMSMEDYNKLTLEDSIEVFELFKQQKGLANFFKLAGK